MPKEKLDATTAKSGHKSRDIFALVAVTVGIFAILALVPIVLAHYLPTPEVRGQFGDMFGLANSLFSGLAFAGLIYTILLQRRELSLQREELALTRVELSRSATALENSEKAMAAQVRVASQTSRLTAIAQLIEYHDRNIERTEAEMRRYPNRGIGTDSPRQRAYLGRALDRLSKELLADEDLPGEPTVTYPSSKDQP
jgi:hypothetical protein